MDKKKILEEFYKITGILDDDQFDKVRSSIDLVDNYIRNNDYQLQRQIKICKEANFVLLEKYGKEKRK